MAAATVTSGHWLAGAVRVEYRARHLSNAYYCHPLELAPRQPLGVALLETGKPDLGQGGFDAP